MSHVIPSRSKISIKYVTDIIQVTVHKVRNLENTDVIGKSGPFVIKESNVDKNVEVKKIITEFLKDNDNEAFYIFFIVLYCNLENKYTVMGDTMDMDWDMDMAITAKSRGSS